MRRVFSITRAVGHELDDRYFDDAVAADVGAGGPRSKNDQRTREFQFHIHRWCRLEFTDGHWHEEHEKLCIFRLGARTEHTGTAGVAEVDDNVVAFEGVENLGDVGSVEALRSLPV